MSWFFPLGSASTAGDVTAIAEAPQMAKPEAGRNIAGAKKYPGLNFILSPSAALPSIPNSRATKSGSAKGELINNFVPYPMNPIKTARSSPGKTLLSDLLIFPLQIVFHISTTFYQ
jgi:hypothetical protein